jgi:hypothetical protein
MSGAGGTALLLDLSASMAWPAGRSGKTRREVLEQAVAGLVPRYPDMLVLAFNDDVGLVTDPQHGLPAASGGTDLAKALNYIKQYDPRNVIVVTDGEPNEPASAALTAALRLNCRISAIYCGDESNRQAVAFLSDLARCSRAGTVGVSKTVSLAKPKDFAEEVLKLAGPQS